MTSQQTRIAPPTRSRLRLFAAGVLVIIFTPVAGAMIFKSDKVLPTASTSPDEQKDIVPADFTYAPVKETDQRAELFINKRYLSIPLCMNGKPPGRR